MTETQVVNNPIHKAFHYSFEISKDAIDLDERIIEGFATTEDVDREDQVVSLKAVEKALNQYLRNPTIRADHHPPPIGKTISAEPRILNGKKGLWIRAQIGKGTQACEDAWSGIQQGLYGAFSIGGIVKGIKTFFSRKLKRHIQEINDILISEISITDAPANQECMFEVIAKSVDANGLEDRKMSEETETQTDLTKELEFSKRLEAVEASQAQTSKDIAEIKELLTKQAPDKEDEEDTEEERKKKENKAKGLTPQQLALKKDLEAIGLTFPEEPQRPPDQGNTPPPTNTTPAPEGPLTLSKMIEAKYKGGMP